MAALQTTFKQQQQFYTIKNKNNYIKTATNNNNNNRYSYQWYECVSSETRNEFSEGNL